MAESAPSPPTMYAEINGENFPLELGQLYLFGKHLSTTTGGSKKIVFNLEEVDVDDKHCCVEVSVREDVHVFDLFSTYGTFVNGERLKPLEKTCIKHGDVMKLGTLQSVRFYDEQLEESHDSSGFGDNNKNSSDIISSSPETTSHREGRLKRFINHTNDNFLVPSVPQPSKKIPRKSNSFVIPETEQLNSSRNSLGINVSQNKSRHSDSFTIPETQYCKARASTGSNLSIAESNADEDENKSRYSLNALGNNNKIDDDFCIPETQEFIPKQERIRNLKDNGAVNGLKTLEEKSVDLNDSDDDDINNVSQSGSLFRICTQDYNEGFDEESSASLHSQVIPFIKHTTVLLNSSSAKPAPVKSPGLEISSKEFKQTNQEDDEELSKINWAATNKVDDGMGLRDLNSSTPDLFEFAALGNVQENAKNNDGENGVKLFEEDPPVLEDEEDFMPTQLFPASNNCKSNDKDKDKQVKEKPIFSAKDDDQFFTLSDKENMHPDRLEPVTDLPPTELFDTANEAPSERSLPSTSARKSNLSKPESKKNESPDVVINPNTSNKEATSALMLHVTGDEEDDILTQAFVQPLPKLKTATSKPLITNCFNSTLLDDRAVDKNPATFFAEMEKTPKKVQSVPESSNAFKLPGREFISIKKTSSAASTASTTTVSSDYSDMDLLMCTPQLIKEHMCYSKSDDLKKHILAARNKKLFGDDTDEGEEFEEDRKSKEKCLVQLINVPKDSKDFDQLLPHLKDDNEDRQKKKNTLTEEQRASKDAGKKFKFNISFGHEQEKNQKSSNGKSSTLSRDERHAARDKEKEKEVGEKKAAQKKLDQSLSNDTEHKKSRRTKHAETKTEAKPETQSSSTHKTKKGEDEGREAVDQKKTNKISSRSTNKLDSSKEKKIPQEDTSKKSKHDTKEIAVENGKNKEENSHKKDGLKKTKETDESVSSNTERPTRRRTRLQSTDKPKDKTEETSNKGPARRVTRLKSSKEEQEKLSTNKVSAAVGDDLDLMPTQPLMPRTRTRTRSRSSQKDDNGLSDASSNTKLAQNPRIRTRSRSSQKDGIEESDTSNTSSSRTLIRRSSNLNTSHSALMAHGSSSKAEAVTTSVSERKRKADIPVPQQNVERKRLKPTSSTKSSTSTSTSSKASSRCLISITMVDPERFNELNEQSKGFWAVAKDPKDSDILVMDKSFRTFKFLLAVARGIPIVTSHWLKDVNEAKSLKEIPAPNKYIFIDPAFEKKHKFCLTKSLQLAKDNKKGVFNGYDFVMTPNIKPSPEEMKAIIEISGGNVHEKVPPPSKKDNQKIYLVSSSDDRKDWHKYRRLNTNIIIINTEAIMSTVMRQNCAPLSNHILA